MVRLTSTGARPTDGSSMRRMRGASISARASASICCSPPLIDPASCERRSASRGKHSKQNSRLAFISARAIEERCAELIQLVGLAGKARKWPRDLTQVEMRKLELARAMAAEPKLLIADEAMAGLSHSEIDDILALLMRLNERGITIILIEHIMRAVMSFSQRVVVLVSAKKIADAPPERIIQDPEVVRAYLGQ